MTDEFGSDGGWEVAASKENQLNWLWPVTFAALLLSIFACFYLGYFMLAAWVGGAMMLFALFSELGHGCGAAWSKAGIIVVLANLIVLCVVRASHSGYIPLFPHLAIVAVGLGLVVVGGVLKKRGK